MNDAESSSRGTVSEAQDSSKSIEKRRSSSMSPDGEQTVGKRIVEVACWPCRRRKGKCSGERPACTSCSRRGVDCSYEYEEGLTRIGSLRLKLDQATARAESLQYLFEQLRARNDNEAACLLAIIRLGADIDLVVEKLMTEPDLLWARKPDLQKLGLTWDR